MTPAFTTRQRTAALGALLLLGIFTAFYYEAIEPVRRQQRFAQSVRADLETLAAKPPPPGLTAKQWRGVVDWTLNAQANCLRFQKSIRRDDMDRFEADLKRRVRGPVDLGTVDWVWDEIARISMQGARYAETWRPTTPRRLAEIEAAPDAPPHDDTAPAPPTSVR